MPAKNLSGRSFVVLGAGVVGLSLARRLQQQGGNVLLCEIRKAGGGASGAAAGVLKAPRLGRSLLARLATAAHAGYERFARELEQESGISPEFRRCGYVDLAVEEAEESKLRKSMGTFPPGEARWLDSQGVRDLVPGVSASVRGALFLPRAAWIHPPALIAALRRSVELSGVEVREGQSAALSRGAISRKGGRAGWDVILGGGDRITGREVIVAAGAWTGPLLESAGLQPAAPIQPIRGQMVELEYDLPLDPILHHAGTYVISRPGELVWVGATVEEVGFCETNSRDGIDGLVSAARNVLPDLGGERRAWAGLRPKLMRRGGPLIGEGEPPVIAGHYRSGIQLGPLTAHVLASRLAEEDVPEDFSTWK